MFDWITGFVESAGYLGIALLMLIENVFPPIPSELIMPMAGFSAARGELSIVLVIVAGIVGSVLGAVFWYFVGKWIGVERLKGLSRRHGRWLTLSPDDIEKAESWFARYGGVAVLIGRLVPAVRTLISVPAGIAAMPFGRFLLFSTFGTAVWTAFLALAGYFLAERYEAVESYLNPVSNAVLGGLVLWYAYRVWTFDPGQRTDSDAR